MTDARLSWKDNPDDSVPFGSESELRDRLRSIEEAEASELAVIVALEVAGATLTHVVGDPSGSSMVYFPPGHEESGAGSTHSVGDAAGRDRDERDPPQVAYMNGQHSELPRWMVIPTAVAENALVSFMLTGGLLPETIEWELD
jgi:hypothetical protein